MPLAKHSARDLEIASEHYDLSDKWSQHNYEGLIIKKQFNYFYFDLKALEGSDKIST